MHRLALVPAATLLAACATTPGQMASPVAHGVCVDGPGQAYLGQLANAENGTGILKETGGTVIRWVAPGQMVTMEFRADRVTVHYGPDMKITQVSCG